MFCFFVKDDLLESITKIPTGHLGFDFTYKQKNIYDKCDMNVIKYQMKKLSLQNNTKNDDESKTNDNNDDECQDDPDEVHLPRDYYSRLDLGLLEVVTDRDFLIHLSLVPGIINHFILYTKHFIYSFHKFIR